MCCRTILISKMPHSHFPDSMNENKGKDRIVYDTPIKGNMDDITFAIQNWYPLKSEEVIERNPFMIKEIRRMYDMMITDEDMESYEDYERRILSNHFYSCNQLDEATGRCMTHDNLPKVCSAYPYYDHEKITEENTLFYTEDCYYRNEIQTEEGVEKDESDTKPLEV